MDQLKKFAEGIGVEVKTSKGADRTKADILSEVKGVLFPGTVDEEVVLSDDKEEKER